MRKFGLTASGSALRIAITYGIFAALWIFFSDRIAGAVADSGQLVLISIIKGWFFVLITSVLLFFLVRQDLARIYNAEMEWRLLFDSVNDSIYLFGLTDNRLPGQFIDINDAGIQKLGYSCEEFRKMTPWDLTAADQHISLREFLDELVRSGKATLESVHLTKDDRRIAVELSARALSMSDNTDIVVIARDITERKQAEEERKEAALAAERDKRTFYKETILAVTAGKFELGESDDVDKWIMKPDLVIQIGGAEQLGEARHSAADYCRRQGMSDDKVHEFEMAFGEALGNAVKHAGSGCLYAGRRDSFVWVAVADSGTGIDTFAIPRVALLTGYTTKASMGLGYTMILEVCDHVKLSTGPQGTTVVMEKNLKDLSDVEQRMSIHSAIK